MKEDLKYKSPFPEFKSLKFYSDKFTLTICIWLILSAFLLTSCGDDPVTVKEEDFDPPRFNWRTMEVNYQGEGFAGLWASDTGNIFLINNYLEALIKISNGVQSSFVIGDYLVNDIKGISVNEVYIFGVKFYPDNRLTIIKWNGGGFEYYPTDIFITGNNNFWILGNVVSSNEIWACSPDGIVRFDGANMTYYTYEDPLLIPMDFYKTPDNKIQFIYNRWQSDSLWHTGYYEFRDTGFVKAFGIIGNPYITDEFTFLDEVGGYKLGIRHKFSPYSVCIDNFNGNSFVPYFCYNKIASFGATETGSLRGTNLQNFIFLATAWEYIFEPYSRLGILHWNGSKVSKEIGLAPFNSPYRYATHILFCLNPDTYIIFEPHSFYNNGIPYLYIGAKK